MGVAPTAASPAPEQARYAAKNGQSYLAWSKDKVPWGPDYSKYSKKSGSPGCRYKLLPANHVLTRAARRFAPVREFWPSVYRPRLEVNRQKAQPALLNIPASARARQNQARARQGGREALRSSVKQPVHQRDTPNPDAVPTDVPMSVYNLPGQSLLVSLAPQ